LNNAICLRDVQIFDTHAFNLKSLSLKLRSSGFPRRRQRSLQYFTLSQTLAHFRRHAIGLLQTAHVLLGKFSFRILDISLNAS
jgi:hypothetical protein